MAGCWFEGNLIIYKNFVKVVFLLIKNLLRSWIHEIFFCVKNSVLCGKTRNSLRATQFFSVKSIYGKVDLTEFLRKNRGSPYFPRAFWRKFPLFSQFPWTQIIKCWFHGNLVKNREDRLHSKPEQFMKSISSFLHKTIIYIFRRK